MVRACLRVLKHHGVIAFMDIFQYSNIYEITSYGAEILCCAERSNRVLSDALAFALKSSSSSNSSSKRHNIINPSLHPNIATINNATTSNIQTQPQNNNTYPTSIMLDPSSSSIIPPLSSTPTPPKNPSTQQYHHHHLPPNTPPRTTARNTNRNNTNTIKTNTHDILSISKAKKKENRILKSMLKDLYTAFHRNTTVSEVLINKWNKNYFELFDHRRFITFGVLNGWLKRIHCFPIVYDAIINNCNDNNNVVEQKVNDKKNNSNNNTVDPFIQQVISFMDGTKCDDELSCFFQMPFTKLIDLVKLDGNKDVCFIYREL